MRRRRPYTLVAVIALAAAGAGSMYGGVYDISATDQHLAPTYWVLDNAMRRSVKRRAAAIAAPSLEEPALAARGLAHFRAHCVQCHGAPGVAPELFALAMTPKPANLAFTARHWSPAELFWVIKHGIKMTGMPAWERRLGDEDIWAVVAFLGRLPALSPSDYRAYETPALEAARADAALDHAPDPERGKEALHQYACLTCHRIPGMVGANAPVGPPLDRYGSRGFVAGILPNHPDNIVRWIRAPHDVDPASAMPALGVTERDARDIAAFLATLK